MTNWTLFSFPPFFFWVFFSSQIHANNSQTTSCSFQHHKLACNNTFYYKYLVRGKKNTKKNWKQRKYTISTKTSMVSKYPKKYNNKKIRKEKKNSWYHWIFYSSFFFFSSFFFGAILFPFYFIFFSHSLQRGSYPRIFLLSHIIKISQPIVN